MGQGIHSVFYSLTEWVLGIVIFVFGYFILSEHFSWGSITAILLIAYMASSILVNLVARLIDARQKRLQSERFTQKMQGRQNPLSLAIGQPTAFSRQWESVLASPAATIFLSADNDALQIVSHGLSHDILLPVAMIEQIEFDPGDGPLYRQNKGVSWQRKWFGQPFPPTVFLGIKCIGAGALFVYPLCFHQPASGDARDLYRRLMQTLQSVAAPIPFQLSGDALENSLPPSRENRSLRIEFLRRFWPNYRAAWAQEWLYR